MILTVHKQIDVYSNCYKICDSSMQPTIYQLALTKYEFCSTALCNFMKPNLTRSDKQNAKGKGREKG